MPNELVEILDTAPVQRLRKIKQLGTAYFVYLGALHTRFEHSLGTYHLAHKLIQILQEFGAKFTDRELLIAGASALLHDIGHMPFGHTIEDERRIFSRHDSPERFCYFFYGDNELATVLQKYDLADPVFKVLCGQSQYSWIEELISGTFCADLLDYLARDAFFCGLVQKYDERIFRTFRLDEGHIYLDCQRSGFMREDVISEIINLLRLRYFLTERVFFHHTKTASGAMISKIIERALDLGLSLQDLLSMGDEKLLAYIEFNLQDGIIQKLLKYLEVRHIYKRAYFLTKEIGQRKELELVNKYHKNPQLRQKAEKELTEILNFAEGDLIIYCPSEKMQLKEAEVSVKIGKDNMCNLSVLNLPEVQVMQEKHRNLWRFYVFVNPELADRIEIINKVCQQYFEIIDN
ncbi:HD domain-containing protein [bacterium]|nr:HD domain-containing protein [bacterium]